MVVLAASVVSKSGKALVSRQYMDMSRVRIEGLLAAFPKLVGSGKQHTYVETENVRYVYQPMEGLYVLLVTNKNSNILEDLDTLRLISKVLPEYAGSLEDDAVCRAAFQLIFAFDEVISAGHKENITVPQIKQNCDMESHEEKLHKMIIQSKIQETKVLMQEKATAIDKSKLESKRAGSSGLVLGGPGGYHASLGGMGSSAAGTSKPSYERGPSFSAPVVSSSSGAGGRSAAAGRGGSKGMQLGKAGKNSSLLESLAKEGEAVLVADGPPGRPAAVSGAAAAAAAAGPADPVFLNIEEKLLVALSKDGGVDNVEVQGTMSLVVSGEQEAFVRVATRAGPNPGYQFKTHPNIDKGAYSSGGVLGLKDPSRPFPTGSELGILKWRLQARDEALVPLTVSCWPSQSGADSYVNIEYESSDRFDLQNVTIVIPLPHTSHAPDVKQCEGDWQYDQRRRALLWTVDLIDDTNRTGLLEFVVPFAEPSAFYPIDISFSAGKTFCDIDVESVTQTQTGQPSKYGFKRVLQTSQYQVA